MGKAAGIITKLNAVLNKVGPPTRTVYKRVVTRTGGDDLIGRPGTVTNADTLLDPQPFYSDLDKEAAELNGTGAKIYMPDDKRVIVSPDSMTYAECTNPNLFIVLKDSSGVEEQFLLVDFKRISIEGVDVALVLIIRSVRRA
jgi:hypothetical protein